MTIVTLKKNGVLPLDDKIFESMSLEIGDILEFKIDEIGRVTLTKYEEDISQEDFEQNEMLVKVEEYKHD
jgi:hypothetical protein